MDKSGSGLPVGALYCREPDGTVHTVRRSVRIPNAIAVSPDGGTLYFSDSPTKQILAFDLDQHTGELANERVFTTFAGEDKPDGTAIDTEGGVWVAVVHGARIDHFSARGDLLASIPMPVQKPTMAALAARQRHAFRHQPAALPQRLPAREHPLTGALLAVTVKTKGFRGFTVQLRPDSDRS